MERSLLCPLNRLCVDAHDWAAAALLRKQDEMMAGTWAGKK